jgi:4a-hydroxytetrahydrobiopterin dehydratase
MPVSPLLSPSELAAALATLPGWQAEGGHLVHGRKFSSYLDGVRFAGAVAEVAEAMNHHPDILIRWRQVRLSIFTHSAGGLTERDAEFARRVSALT